MNLLVLSPWFPYPPDNGSRLRAFHLLRALSAQGHRIRLVTGLQDDMAAADGLTAPEALRALCDEIVIVPWRWPGESGGDGIAPQIGALLSPVPRSIREMENPEFRDAVRAQCAKPTEVALAMELGIHSFVPTGLPFPVVIDQVEVSGMERAWRTAASATARLRSGMTLWKGARYWRRELRRYAAITAVSEEEAAAVRGVLGKASKAPEVHVVPNGVEVNAFPAVTGKRTPVPGRIIYNGALTYGPNRDAVEWFADAILPLMAARGVPEAHLVVTGRYDEASAVVESLRRNARVHLTGFLPDLRPALSDATVCAVPLRSGGGTRLKILEAWAAGVPVVSTTIGAAGLDGEPEKHFLRADTPETIADAVARILREPQGIGAELARNARLLAEQRYDWSAIGDRLCALLETARKQKQEKPA